MKKDDSRVVAADFPREQNLASISGVQPKLVGRMVDGAFITGLTDQEFYARYEVCVDLVNQLTVYCIRKLNESRVMDVPTLLPLVQKSAESKDWDLSVLELAWVMKQLASRLEEQQVKEAQEDCAEANFARMTDSSDSARLAKAEQDVPERSDFGKFRGRRE
ncbi:hypothetical protein LNV08_22335 [Paucibacter sp. TC2R-5]|uniref:hypothetical protein n=1 Tax=Paucibacter sp. TC2R-5 TaxID=2893555 RepID=UPI0021E40F07|nr:hypothetical protein [Paucibacter sp. TC2R-5]MCV2361709.1 hypothetical protein [Paucibacter sp. TC2R-5]